MRKYCVNLGDRAYDIHIEPGCLDRVGRELKTLIPEVSRCMVVTNETVAPLYFDVVQQSLQAENIQVFVVILPDGEQFKQSEHWMSILNGLMEAQLSRNEPLLALGGGVVGDMAGFAAACYRRGIPYVQIPTTLLSQVDSSVGGKTAINHPHGKNMIGAFYQPRLVWIDPDVLQTLPVRELRAGMVEMVKYGLIRDRSFMGFMAQNAMAILDLDENFLVPSIYESCKHKAELVIADETEQGQRALLNLGHTFGHAIESMTHYKTYLHGEAVGIGIRMACRLSEQLGLLSSGSEEEIVGFFEKTGMDVSVPEFPVAQWMEAMGHDKKSDAGLIRYILLRDLGDAFIDSDVPTVSVEQMIASFHGEK